MIPAELTGMIFYDIVFGEKRCKCEVVLRLDEYQDLIDKETPGVCGGILRGRSFREKDTDQA